MKNYKKWKKKKANDIYYHYIIACSLGLLEGQIIIRVGSLCKTKFAALRHKVDTVYQTPT